MSDWIDIARVPAPTDRYVEVRGRSDLTRKTLSTFVVKWDADYGAFVSRSGNVVLAAQWREYGATRDRPAVRTGRYGSLVQHLKHHSALYGHTRTRERSTPFLSQTLGIRNVPDAIRKLRARGHVIETTIAPVQVNGIAYDAVGIYTYVRGK